MGTSMVVTSGKSGAGKTTVTCGVASALAELGNRVLCIDVDLGQRKLDAAMGLTDLTLMDFSDVIGHQCSLEAAVCRHPAMDGLYLLNAPGFIPSTQISEAAMHSLLLEAKALFDYVLINCPAGVGSGFYLAVYGADRALVVATAEEDSIRAARRTASSLKAYRIPIHLVVNRVGQRLLRRLHETVGDAMDAADFPLLGLIPEDARVPELCGRGELVIEHTYGGAAKAYRNISSRLTGRKVPLMWL